MMNLAAKWVAAMLLLGCATAQACPALREFDGTGAALKITRADLNYEREESGGTITTLAAVKNTAAVCVENVVVEVNYFNDQKKLIDTVTQLLYGVVVQPSQEVSFRVRETAARDKAAYTSVEVRVVAAEQRVGRTRRAEDAGPKWTDVLWNWGPMLLLIAVWVFFAYRKPSRNSAQGRLMELVEAQTAVQARQAAALERLGDTVEKASGHRSGGA